jgi:hypothetical protein
MVGISAQDPNIQNLFQLARQRTAWTLNDSPPPHVFGTNEIGDDQKTVLRTAISRILLSTVLKNRGLKAAQIRRGARRLKSDHWHPFYEERIMQTKCCTLAEPTFSLR